jgi:hypothetical protein
MHISTYILTRFTLAGIRTHVCILIFLIVPTQAPISARGGATTRLFSGRIWIYAILSISCSGKNFSFFEASTEIDWSVIGVSVCVAGWPDWHNFRPNGLLWTIGANFGLFSQKEFMLTQYGLGYILGNLLANSPEGSFLNEFLRLQKSLRLGNVGFWLSSSLRAA